MARAPALYTIGHSRQSVDRFIELVRQHDIVTLVDIRSHPISRFAPQFNRKALASALAAADIGYEFAGDTLGGRPPEGEYYDSDGYVLYGRIAGSERFLSAFRALKSRLAEGGNIAVMCAEEDPAGCHRHLLVGRLLERDGIEVRHIRADGRVHGNEEAPYPGTGGSQPRLVEDDMESWRSVRPAAPASRAKGAHR